MRIAVIDDDPDIRVWFEYHLKEDGHEVLMAENGKDGLDMICKEEPDLTLVDLMMPVMDGLEMTKAALKEMPTAQIILITAHASVRTAVGAMKVGAVDYLTKPMDIDEVRLLISRVAEKQQLLRQNRLMREQLQNIHRGELFTTRNEKVEKLLDQAIAAAQTDATILITGENGTGKEVFANYIYRNSLRAEKQFVVVNCAAISEQLLESEIFGHAKGSFTGAIQDHPGYFEVANGGTIFLDETGEISPNIQVKLLRVLQDGEYSRVGETRTRKTDVRIIAATNQNIDQLIKDGAFREDFYYRINVFEFHLPPLRERPEDIMFYFEMFVQQYASQMGKKILEVDPAVRQLLMIYDWPGNIRELKNVAERTTILCDNEKGIITPDLFPPRLGRGTGEPREQEFEGHDYKATKEMVVRDFEINFITQQLRKCKGNVAATARKIGVHPVFLRQKIANLGIDAKDIRKELAGA